MPGIYDAFTQGRQNGEARYAKHTLSQHLMGAIGGDQAALAQVYSADPNAGMQAQKMARQTQQDDMGDVAKAADFYRKTGDPKAYAYLHQRLSSNPQFAGLPATIDTPEDQEGAKKFAETLVQVYGERGAPELAPRVIGDSLVDSTGKPIYTAPAKQDYQWSERAGAWIPKPMAGGMQQPSPQGQPMVKDANGTPVNLSPDLSPEDRAAIMANPDAWGQVPDGGSIALPPMDRGPAQRPAGLAAIPVAGIGPKEEGRSRVLSPSEVAAYGLPSGTVAQIGADGKIDIVSKPDAREGMGGGKALPMNVVNAMTKDSEKLSTLSGLAASFKPDFAGNGMGGGLENLAGRVGVPLATPGQAEWWQSYDRIKNEVRNELFGASLTTGEQKAFEAADITPNMDPKVVSENLAMQTSIIDRGLKRKAKVWAAQGYNRAAIQEATGIDVGEAAKPTGPVRIQSAADYEALPSGAEFITPDGQHKRKR